jgi:hypothetical protein
MNRYVYTLRDPRVPDAVRYVGVTQGTLERRLRQHVSTRNSPRTPVAHWIAKLDREGVQPIILAEMVLWREGGSPYDFEPVYIEKYRRLGHALLNVTPGGRGGGIGPKSAEHRARISAALKGRKAPERTPEWRAAHAEKLRGRRHSEETRAKMSAAAKARWSA